MMIEFFARGEPKGQPRPRAFAMKIGDKYQARVFDAGTAEAWKQQIAVAAKDNALTKFNGPVQLVLQFAMPRPKGHFNSKGAIKESAPLYHTKKCDIDNYCKAVMDALTICGAWGDDAQVSVLTASKFYATDHVGCMISIRELECPHKELLCSSKSTTWFWLSRFYEKSWCVECNNGMHQRRHLVRER